MNAESVGKGLDFSMGRILVSMQVSSPCGEQNVVWTKTPMFVYCLEKGLSHEIKLTNCFQFTCNLL